MMSYEGLIGHYRNNFALFQHHKWSVSDVESLIPWERRLYIDLLEQFIKEEEMRIREQENQQKAEMQSMLRRRKM